MKARWKDEKLRRGKNKFQDKRAEKQTELCTFDVSLQHTHIHLFTVLLFPTLTLAFSPSCCFAQ